MAHWVQVIVIQIITVLMALYPSGYKSCKRELLRVFLPGGEIVEVSTKWHKLRERPGTMIAQVQYEIPNLLCFSITLY